MRNSGKNKHYVIAPEVPIRPGDGRFDSCGADGAPPARARELIGPYNRRQCKSIGLRRGKCQGRTITNMTMIAAAIPGTSLSNRNRLSLSGRSPRRSFLK